MTHGVVGERAIGREDLARIDVNVDVTKKCAVPTSPGEEWAGFAEPGLWAAPQDRGAATALTPGYSALLAQLAICARFSPQRSWPSSRSSAASCAAVGSAVWAQPWHSPRLAIR